MSRGIRRPQPVVEGLAVRRVDAGRQAAIDGDAARFSGAARLRLLARTDAVPFDESIAMDNLMLRTMTTPHSGVSVLQASPLLQFRRLQIVARAVATAEAAAHRAAGEPLKEAWFLAHRNLLRYFEPAGRWFIPVETYWRLHDDHTSAAWAEQLAWTAAQVWIPSDECYEACVLDTIERTYARYWSQYPTGTYVSDALSRE